MRTIIVKEDLDGMINDYKNAISIENIAKKYSIGEKRVRGLLFNNGIEILDSHNKTVSTDTYIEDNLKRFPAVEGKKYVAVAKDSSAQFDDYLNKSGTLINYIKKNFPDTEIPSLFKRKKYFHENGAQWHEQWFDIALVDETKTKKCPYCKWETNDIENKSGAFLVHLKNDHDISIEEHLKHHPEDADYFHTQINKTNVVEKRNKEDDSVICPLCNERFQKLTMSHITKKHNMDYEDFRKKYPYVSMVCPTMKEQIDEARKLGSTVVSKHRFISKYEREIQDFLSSNNIQYETNRQILEGKEIDILIPEKHIGIEFDGLKWHTEWFAKKEHRYHLDKTETCNHNGYGLIHIFEDEYVNNKDIVYSKLSHILGINANIKHIGARQCEIKEIYKFQAEEFLTKNHIQGFVSSSIYLGAFYGEVLVGVMCFKNGNIKNKGWELTRFATGREYSISGLGGKMFTHFVRKYEPYKVYSFADRRWTVDIYNNLYTKIGFEIESINPPDYKYYNDRIDRYKRVHKMSFSKQALAKKYGFPMDMTESEMAKELGYDRIWDCGLVKYVWRKK